MVNPFILSARVRPICINKSTKLSYSISTVNHTVNLANPSRRTNSKNIYYNVYTYNPVTPKLALGEPLAQFNTQNNLYYLTHIVNENSVVDFYIFGRRFYRSLRQTEINNNNNG